MGQIIAEVTADDANVLQLLHVLTLAMQARRVLEIGTGLGHSATSIATALPNDGMLITLERDVTLAATARQRFNAEGLSQRVSVVIGDASRYLHKVAGPFDLIVQADADAQRAGTETRLMELLRGGGLLITRTEDRLTLMAKTVNV